MDRSKSKFQCDSDDDGSVSLDAVMDISLVSLYGRMFRWFGCDCVAADFRCLTACMWGGAVYDPQDYDQYLVKLMFDMNITEIAGLDASFKISVRESICTALDLPASVVVPEEITGDPSVGDNMALSLVMFGPNIKAYVTKMYDLKVREGICVRSERGRE
eukprot:3144415-Rhodomonas_salina.1